MKKEIKKIAAVAMALAMTVGSSIPAFAAKSIVMEGTVDSLDINMTLPTSGLLTIKPYGGTQIDTGIYYFVNNNTLDNDTEGYTNVSYGVSVTKFWAVSTDLPTDKNDLISLAEEIDADTAGTKKIMAPRIQIGTPIDGENIEYGENVAETTPGSKTIATAVSVEASGNAAQASTVQALAFQKGFGKAVVDVPVSVLQKNVAPKTGAVTTAALNLNYSTDEALYTTVTDAATVTIGPEQIAAFRITGSVNTNANWVEGKDGLAIIPVFAITVSTKTNPISQ